ncbi:GPI ethanolamine phosphate transferase 2 [Monosporozyma unispora]
MLRRLTIVFVIQLLAISLFCIGFFPKKNVLNGEAIFHYNKTLQKDSKPVFNKLVVVVIDALRSDFIFDKYSSNFNFVHSKLNSGEAWGFTAFSNPPTVTLPRLKGITTGSTPNFLDAILNVVEDDGSSSISDQDSWLLQLRSNANHRIRFFGDDTWLKLFTPVESIFDSWEGTNSFFVSDFEEVDFNVTRHIPTQIKERDQWDTLILHYLGLDHIGHKGGAFSKFMPNKQTEMDNVIKDIYNNLIDEDSLLVVLGDHGMNDVGNHGGSSAGETHAGMVFLSPKLSKYPYFKDIEAPYETPLNGDNEPSFEFMNQIQQIDLVPTIAAMFNIPIPQNSVGILIPEFLSFLGDDMKYIKVWENLRQLSILNNLTPEIDFNNKNISDTYLTMNEIQQSLTRSATNYSYNKLAVGYCLLIISVIFVSVLVIQDMKFSFTTSLLVFISVVIGISMFGSSFVEEEHQLWWWILTGVLLLAVMCKHKQASTPILCVIIFACLRLLRGWNNSGQKTVYPYVIGNLLNKSPDIQWLLNVTTLVWLSLSININYLSLVDQLIVPTIALAYKANWAIVDKEQVPNYLQKLVIIVGKDILKIKDTNIFTDSLIPMARLFYKVFCVLIVIRISLFATKTINREVFVKGVFKDITIFLLFLSPSKNISQFLLFDIVRRCITQILTNEFNSDITLTSVISLILQNFCFFQFGGTNSIATVDLSNAYHGISSNYNIYVVGLIMAISNFAPAIYWVLFTWQFIYSKPTTIMKGNKWEIFAKSKLPVIFVNCIVGCCLLAACVILRYHLFIWSVFSPKLCYYVVWNLFMGAFIGWIFELSLIAIL